eukprot:scaffold15440_cov139-Isochrysis_galbana.AAC.2
MPARCAVPRCGARARESESEKNSSSNSAVARTRSAILRPEARGRCLSSRAACAPGARAAPKLLDYI